MDISSLPWNAPLSAYDEQATLLLEAVRGGDADAIDAVRHHLPRFLRTDYRWLPRDVSDAQIRDAGISEDEARLAVARRYAFADWQSLTQFARAASQRDSAVSRFEAAVEAVVEGRIDALREMLASDPALAHARSTRVTCFDPPVHRCTLLHYIPANGVERTRARTSPKAVAVARMLLDAGADPDALADLYGGQCTTMALLVSSSHAASAGVHVALVDTLIDYGAAVEARGEGAWTSPLMTALAFGYVDAAEALVRRGARADTLSAAAGLGREDEARRLLSAASPDDRHRALALAAQIGRASIVKLLLEAGEDPNRFNPQGNHAHATPLHHAALGGHDAVVRLLVDAGARLDIRDLIYDATALGWAEHGGQQAVADYLRSR